jgi:hypothetical protein
MARHQEMPRNDFGVKQNKAAARQDGESPDDRYIHIAYMPVHTISVSLHAIKF